MNSPDRLGSWLVCAASHWKLVCSNLWIYTRSQITQKTKLCFYCNFQTLHACSHLVFLWAKNCWHHLLAIQRDQSHVKEHSTYNCRVLVIFLILNIVKRRNFLWTLSLYSLIHAFYLSFNHRPVNRMYEDCS